MRAAALEAQGYRKLAVTYANHDYNSGLAGVFAAAFTELGGTVTGNEAHEPSKASYRAELAVSRCARARLAPLGDAANGAAPLARAAGAAA